MDTENITNKDPPKIFISYAWTNPQHEDWVLQLATDLRSEGIDVILDKWDLTFGNDSLPFMEQMVNDARIKKVLMICDKNYVEKANKRKGGVGIETQIISKKVYEKSDQNKFLAVIRECNDDGSACVPTYYHSRMYIDFTSDATFSDKFRELVLWINDKPIYPKPPIGPKSSLLLDNNKIYPGTSIIQKKVIENITNGRSITQGSIKEYFDEYYQRLDLYRVKYSNERNFVEDILHNLDVFTSFRDEFLSVISYISKYEPDMNVKKSVHKFFENSLSYLDRPDNVNMWYPAEFEIYKFIIYELFIYTMAIFIKGENYDIISYLLNSKYFITKQNQLFGSDTLLSFCALRNHCDFINQVKKYGSMLSPQAAFLKERNQSTNINFYYIMEADFICFLKAVLINDRWYSDTLIYLNAPHRPFEIFAKSVSADYFSNLTKIFGFNNVTDIALFLNKFKNNNDLLPYWEGRGFVPHILIGFEKLALSDELKK